ncbi:RagB/SusD family nutrient uptake outer membrane protein [Marinirhabdus gelatinilytica]|nr:RagB/SusD family nutrient uptake outer membrane protein [Marinirhabdus gelatinilytica]
MNITKLTLIAFSLAIFSSCTFEEVIDPNGPSLDGVQEEASKGQLNELVVGIEATKRNGLGIETTASGTMARELYLFDADPRNTGDLLGKNGIGLDNNSFYSVAQWNGNYRCVKNASILINAANNTSAVTAAEANAYTGYAKTMMAYELIQVLKSYGMARIDIEDPDNLGPILDFGPAMDAIRGMLDDALDDLNGAGGEFPFSLSEGFSGFDTPSTFAQYNRAIAAMAAVYDGDGSGSLNLFSNSYFDIAGDLNTGPKHIFGLGSGDQANPVFRPASTEDNPNNGDQIIVHPSFIDDAEDGDLRVENKTAERPDPSTQDGLTSNFESTLYESNVSPIDLLRNEELILLFAEANIIAGNLGVAQNALDVIRISAGLEAKDYGGNPTSEQLVDELLMQRRYSLWAENHRMFDLRRYGRSNTLPIDRPGDQIFNVLPIPLSESN